MFRIFHADIRKMIHDKGFRTCLMVNILYQFFSVLILKTINILYPKIVLYADAVAFNYGTISTFLIFASTLITTTSDYSDGCIRNKIISGASRVNIYLSGAACGLLHGLIHSVAACITSFLCNLIFFLKIILNNSNNFSKIFIIFYNTLFLYKSITVFYEMSPAKFF